MRNLSLDYFRIFLAFLIILIHTEFLIKTNPDIGYLLVNGVFRLAQPIFLIISGYYFYSIKNFVDFKSWIIRLSALYVIWMIIYSPFWFSFEKILPTLFNIFFGYFVLWYVIGVLLAGIILYCIRNLDIKFLLIVSISLYVVGYIIQTIGGLHLFSGFVDKVMNFTPFYRNFLFKCLPLMIIGFSIRKIDLDKKIYPSFILIIMMVIITMFESYINYKYIGVGKGMDFLLTSLIVCPLIFIYVKNKEIYGKKSNFLKISVALYLVHPLMIKLYNYYEFSFNYYIFVTLTSLILGFIIVAINKRFKYIL